MKTYNEEIQSFVQLILIFKSVNGTEITVLGFVFNILYDWFLNSPTELYPRAAVPANRIAIFNRLVRVISHRYLVTIGCNYEYTTDSRNLSRLSLKFFAIIK